MKQRNSGMSKQNSNGTCGDGKEILMKGPKYLGLRAGQTVTPWGDRVKVAGNCVVTKKPHSIFVDSVELNKWLTGDHLIQDVIITDVSADDREFLMTGISPEGWNVMFPAVTT